MNNSTEFFPFTFIPDALIEAIHADIREAEQELEKTENKEFASHSFFSKTESDTWQMKLTDFHVQ